MRILTICFIFNFHFLAIWRKRFCKKKLLHLSTSRECFFTWMIIFHESEEKKEIFLMLFVVEFFNFFVEKKFQGFFFFIFCFFSKNHFYFNFTFLQAFDTEDWNFLLKSFTNILFVEMFWEFLCNFRISKDFQFFYSIH